MRTSQIVSILFLAWVLMGMGCSEIPTPPRDKNPSGLYLDTLHYHGSLTKIVLRDTIHQWLQDDHGIWRDYQTSLFDTGSGEWAYGTPFIDIPAAYSQFWRYCSNCHSALGKSSLASKAKKSLELNTWEQIQSYGPQKLVLAARGGGMPIAPAPPVPDEVVSRALAYLAYSGDSVAPILLVHYHYKEAENFVRRYCADCHTPAGRHPLQSTAMRYLILDTYAQWHKYEKSIKQRIDTVADVLLIMPPDSIALAKKPSREERRKMMEWIDRWSPNTPDGSGKGDSIPIGNIIQNGAMKGLLFDSASQIINHYCADCHTFGGLNREQQSAWTYALRLDTYQDWANVKPEILAERLDPAIAILKFLEVMPPDRFPFQPTNSERQILLEWLKRSSPNTKDGR